jgi:hypothetical protein
VLGIIRVAHKLLVNDRGKFAAYLGAQAQRLQEEYGETASVTLPCTEIHPRVARHRARGREATFAMGVDRALSRRRAVRRVDR